MGKRIDQEIINQIPILYEKIKTKKGVAEALEISPQTVNKYLSLYQGEPQSITEKKRKKIDEKMIQLINDSYFQTRNMTQTAKELGITPSTVKKYLTEENLALKKNADDDRDALWYYIYRLFGHSG